MVTLATSEGDVWTELAEHPTHGHAVSAGPLRADGTSLRVDLGPGLELHWDRPRLWDRPFGPLGVAQTIPFLGQYWAPWLLSARVTGALGSRSLDGAQAYAEKNWGAAFAEHWWWGQAECVAFAGGRIHGVAPTAIAVWTPEEIVALAPPFARTVTRAGNGEWHVRASSPRWRVELTGEARAPLRLPNPIPGPERRLEVRSSHYLLGRLEVEVRRGRRLWFKGESATAALEDGAA
jgi:Tocopherol cyclase